MASDRAAAAAAAAPVAILATGFAVPTEALLPAGPAMGLRSHGECTTGVVSLAPAPLLVVFVLLVFCVRCLGSVSAAKGAHGVLITG